MIKNDIKATNIGIACDNCSTNLGNNNSIKSKFKKDNKKLIISGDPSHALALVPRFAFKQTSGYEHIIDDLNKLSAYFS